jgi:hypothetical protein
MKREEGRGAEAGAVAVGRREERSSAAIVLEEMRGSEGDVAAASVECGEESGERLWWRGEGNPAV